VWVEGVEGAEVFEGVEGVEGFGFRVWGFGFQISGFGFRLPVPVRILLLRRMAYKSNAWVFPECTKFLQTVFQTRIPYRGVK